MPIKDLTGQKFKKLTVKKFKGSNKHQQALWICFCECGEEKVVSNNLLKSGHVGSCGKCIKKGSSNPKDIQGQRFGRLVAIKSTGITKNETYIWECLCDCGNIKEATVNHLSQGAVMSCGKCKSVIKKGNNYLHNRTNEFVTIRAVISDRVLYQDNMGVKGSLPINVFVKLFRQVKD